jgi:hypothetical protein
MYALQTIDIHFEEEYRAHISLLSLLTEYSLASGSLNGKNRPNLALVTTSDSTKPSIQTTPNVILK